MDFCGNFGTLFWVNRDRNMAPKTRIVYTLEVTPGIPANQVSRSLLELLEEMATNLKKIYQFLPIVDDQNPSKYDKISHSSFHRLLGNIVVHIQAKYWKDRTKSEGTYLIWNKSRQAARLCKVMRNVMACVEAISYSLTHWGQVTHIYIYIHWFR